MQLRKKLSCLPILTIFLIINCIHVRANKEKVWDYLKHIERVEYKASFKEERLKTIELWQNDLSFVTKHNYNLTVGVINDDSYKHYNYNDSFKINYNRLKKDRMERIVNGYNGTIYYNHYSDSNVVNINDVEFRQPNPTHLSLISLCYINLVTGYNSHHLITDMLNDDNLEVLERRSNESNKQNVVLKFEDHEYDYDDGVKNVSFFGRYELIFIVDDDKVHPKSYTKYNYVDFPEGKDSEYKLWQIDFTNYAEMNGVYIPQNISGKRFRYVSQAAPSTNNYFYTTTEPRKEYVTEIMSSTITSIEATDSIPSTEDVFQKGVKVQDNISGEHFILGDPRDN